MTRWRKFLMKRNGYQPTRPLDILRDEPDEIREYRLGRSYIGQKLGNRYEVFGVREGGFSRVFFVTELLSGREYAAKTYKSEYAEQYRSVEQFSAEASFWLNL
jgi:hypothetical protein